MNCANHVEVPAVAYCRTCGKPMCSTCARDVRGVIYCEECLASQVSGTMPPPPQPGSRQLRARLPPPSGAAPDWPRSWDSFPASAPCITANTPRDLFTC